MSNDFWTIIGSIILGIILGLAYVAWLIYRTVSKFENELNHRVKEAIAEVESNLVGITVEKDNDLYYCYSEADKQFMCQGKNLSELREAFKSRFPSKVAYLSGGDTEAIDTLKQELKESIDKQIDESTKVIL